MAIEDVIYNADGTTHSYRINGSFRLATPVSAAEKKQRLAQIEYETQASENINQGWMSMAQTFDNEVLNVRADKQRTATPHTSNFFVDIRYLYVLFAILVVVAGMGMWHVFK